MNIQVSDILYMKKAHPCGNSHWETLRVGMNFKLRCQGCSHEVMLPRRKVEKNIKEIFREGQAISPT